MLQALLPVVETRSDVFDDLIGPAVRCRERLQQCDLTDEIVLVCRSGDSGVEDRHTIRWRLARTKMPELRKTVAPSPSGGSLGSLDPALSLPASQGIRMHLKLSCCDANRNKPIRFLPLFPHNQRTVCNHFLAPVTAHRALVLALFSARARPSAARTNSRNESSRHVATSWIAGTRSRQARIPKYMVPR